jgi:hypothetical protein
MLLALCRLNPTAPVHARSIDRRFSLTNVSPARKSEHLLLFGNGT